MQKLFGFRISDVAPMQLLVRKTLNLCDREVVKEKNEIVTSHTLWYIRSLSSNSQKMTFHIYVKPH